MKIGIITQPLRYNYGGILQNYALQTVLKQMGHVVETLDPVRYVCKPYKYPYCIIRNLFSKYIKGNSQIDVFYEYHYNRETKALGNNVFKFIDDRICRRECRSLFDEIQEEDYDCFVVGSDQVWRPMYNWSEQRSIFNSFLDFTRDWNVKRIAYAASFGSDTNEFNNELVLNRCKELIKRFNSISVREFSGIALCNELFSCEAVQTLDPTLLLNSSDYSQLIGYFDGDLRVNPGELYVYILDETEENKKLISDYETVFGLRSYTYNSKVNDWKNSHSLEEKIQPPVELWLKGFDQAEYVLTDSFHACVFSIIFKKQFYVLANSDRGITRYTSLFDMLGMEYRFVNNINDVLIMKEIDYDSVYDKLDQLRKESRAFLLKQLRDDE